MAKRRYYRPLGLFKKARLKTRGGNTGPYGLRALGKDTFLLTNDVVGYFTQRNIISGSAQSKRSLNAIQNSFNDLQQQSGRSFAELSMIISKSVGDNLF